MGSDAVNARLGALAEAFSAFAAATADYRSLLDTVAAQLVRLVGDACAVMLADASGAWRAPGSADAREPHAAALLRAAVALPPACGSSGLAQRVLRTGDASLVPTVEPAQLADVAEPAFADAVRELGIRSFLSVPLEVRGRRLGVLSMFRYAAASPPFDRDDLALARTLADHAALAIANAELVESLQRELAERARAEEEAKTFVSLVENSTDMIAMAAFDGRVLFLNAAGRRLVGLGADIDVRAMTLADFHTKDGLARARIIQEQGSWQGEGVLRHQGTGDLIPVQVSTFLARDAAGQPICYATVQRDLRAYRRLEDELRQAQRMEALGRLAGGVAHDFNNLLTVILSYCTIVARALPAESRVAADVEQIERAGHRAAELTHQLLAFSRQQVLQPQPIDLDDTLRAMDGMLHRLVGEDIELRVTGGKALGQVLVDAGQVEQVVMNLVVNARDAMQAGGVLALHTQRVELVAIEAALLGVSAGAYNVLAVTDTGVGMDANARAHIFEPFFTTKALGKGTGLGLSTAMGIVKQSRGNITVDSELGRGSTFRVYLPCTAAPVAPAPAPVRKRRATESLRGTERVLVVEDEAQVRVLVGEVLRGAGYRVVEAADGEAALAAAQRADGAIHLLLTDVIIPRLSGPQLAERFLLLHPNARVVYMSGYTEDRLGQHGVLDPGVELIQKPLSPDALLARVREVLDAR